MPTGPLGTPRVYDNFFSLYRSCSSLFVFVDFVRFCFHFTFSYMFLILIGKDVIYIILF